jgi:hypothetical protein
MDIWSPSLDYIMQIEIHYDKKDRIPLLFPLLSLTNPRKQFSNRRVLLDLYFVQSKSKFIQVHLMISKISQLSSTVSQLASSRLV